MQFRATLVFIALLAFALLASSAPVPESEGAQLKRVLKQYNARQGIPARRQDFRPKPSKYVYYVD